MEAFMELIPPEQVGIIVASLIGLIAAIFAAIAYFVKWSVSHHTKVQDIKLIAMEQKLQKEKLEFEATLRRQDYETQSKLDETLSTRENTRLLFSELAEERKDNAAQREAFERQREAQISLQKEQLEVNRGIQANTAATYELLKMSRDNDDILIIKQDRIIRQIDDTQAKVDIAISTVTGGLEDVKNKLDAILIETRRNPNREVLEQMGQQLTNLIIVVKPLADIIHRSSATQPLPLLDETQDLHPPTQETNEPKKDAA